MPRRRRTLALGALALGGGGAAAAQARLLRRIATDPADAALRAFQPGRPLTVTSADGTELHAEVFGREDAPTIVLIHGWTEAIAYWAFAIDELVRDFRVVAYDLRGHGRSGRATDADYSLERFGQDVDAVLRVAVPDGRVRLVAGHSLGAMSIASWADQFDVTARAESAALLNTGLGGLIAGAAVVAVPAFAKRLQDPLGRRLFLGSRSPIPPFTSPLHHLLISYLAFGPTATPGMVEFYRRLITACPPDVRAAVGLAMADMELDPALAKLTIPTLVMAGERDRLTPVAQAERIASELPQLAELIVLPNTGHMGPLERPAEVSAALRELAVAAGEPQAAPV
jgi:pimeloyl-ACP methyl ester carboxylesterase